MMIRESVSQPVGVGLWYGFWKIKLGGINTDEVRKAERFKKSMLIRLKVSRPVLADLQAMVTQTAFEAAVRFIQLPMQRFFELANSHAPSQSPPRRG